MWARWWIEHPVQYCVFKVFDCLRKCLLYTILVCMFIPIPPMLVIGFGAALVVALHWLLFQLTLTSSSSRPSRVTCSRGEAWKTFVPRTAARALHT